MNNLIEYSPIIIVVMGFFIAYKVFVTPEQLGTLKSSLIEYMSEHYVSDKTYRENHRNLQEQLALIHHDINDVEQTSGMTHSRNQLADLRSRAFGFHNV